MSELLAHTLPRIAKDGAGSWDEEATIYENGKICPSPAPVSQHDADNPADDEAKPLCCERNPKVYEQQPVNRFSQKPVKLPVHMESMLHDIEFRQSNRSADFIAGVDEAESNQRFINRGRLLHTLFSAIETEEDIDNAISQLIFEGVIGRSETEERNTRPHPTRPFLCHKSRTGIQEHGSCSMNATSSGRRTANCGRAARTA